MNLKKVAKISALIFLIVVVLISGFFLGIYKGWIGNLPTIENLNKSSKPSVIISSDGKILGKFENKGKIVKFNKLPKNLIDALILKEDKRFFQHNGIDFLNLSKSTITQKLVHLLKGNL